jgi:hypothetical protein
MQNPYKRLRELTTTSQKDFAAKHGFSKTAMIFVESGQPVDVSDDMNKALGKECADKGVDAISVLRDEYGSQTLSEAYHNWQNIERMQVASQFQKQLSGQHDKTTSPFAYFVKDIAGSDQGFCKLLKVPVGAVQAYASGKTRSMPKSLEAALRAVNFPYLSELLGLQLNWLDENS